MDIPPQSTIPGIRTGTRLFQSSWWLDAASGQPCDFVQLDWSGRVVARLYFTRSRRFGLTRLRMPPFTRTLAPFCDPPPSKPAQRLGNLRRIARELLAALPPHDLLEFALDPDEPPDLAFAFEQAGARIGETFTFRTPPPRQAPLPAGTLPVSRRLPEAAQRAAPPSLSSALSPALAPGALRGLPPASQPAPPSSQHAPPSNPTRAASPPGPARALLPPDPATAPIWTGLDQKTRNVIRSAAAHCAPPCQADFTRFAALYAAEHGPEAALSLPILRRLHEAAETRGQGAIRLVSAEGQDLAATFLVWDDEIMYLLATARSHAGPGGANALMVWDAITLAALHGLSLDLDGYKTPGSARFLASFGLPLARRTVVTSASLRYRAASEVQAALAGFRRAG